MGFTAIAKHRERKVTLYRQGDINFLVNEEPDSFAADFARAHGPSACGFAIRVADAARARAWAIDRGAEALSNKPATLPVRVPVIEGIGGSALYLVDRYGERGSIYDAHFEYLDGVDRHPGLRPDVHRSPDPQRLPGQHGQVGGLLRAPLQLPRDPLLRHQGRPYRPGVARHDRADGMVRIPINEATDDKSQIAEYLDEYNGEGIQHIALFTDDIYASVEALRADGIEFLDVPDTYYEMVDGACPATRKTSSACARIAS
jgi:4-hydroxyphenylpyruvate dioxygenase